MSEILGYGEDALTLWALKRRVSTILNHFRDTSSPSDCLVFYRPSFGRHAKENSSVFGEFDAIVASPQNIYLVESKWDNLVESKKDKLVIRREQLMRHQIFTWYLAHWKKKYSNKWADFIEEQQSTFNFGRKTIAPANSLLAKNLEFVLSKVLERCRAFSCENNVKNILLFFYRGKTRAPLKINEAFTLIAIDYGKEAPSNFISL
jgi:hypothetical protein